jgi:hypothetical protein
MPIGDYVQAQWTFLELCQRTAQEAGIGPGTVPTTVLAQTGELRRIVNWVASSWFDIQAAHKDWKFLRKSVSFQTVLGTATYTPSMAGADWFGRWVKDSFRVWKTATGIKSEIPLEFMPYEWWRDMYQIGAMRSAYSQPMRVTVTPDRSLGLGPVPLDGYTIDGDYYGAPVELMNDTDIPLLPDGHNPMIIVNGALMSYGVFFSAPEVYQSAKIDFDKMYSQLRDEQLPPITLGGALA